MSDRFILLSGCSGGGKSTLLAELARRGHATVPEPGRRIVAAELENGGGALPWLDLAAFARRAIALALADRAAAAALPGPVFFDRGLVDAAAALEHATGEPVLAPLGRAHRYHPTVFLTPPWPELRSEDPQRRQRPGEAEAEYARLLRAYAALGYRRVVLPKCSVAARAGLLLAELGLPPG